LITAEELEKLRDRFYAERNEHLFGVREDLTNEEYHAANGLSNSGCGLISKSPYHLLNKPQLSSDSLSLGTGVHAALLEPALWEEGFIRGPDDCDQRSKQYKEAQRQADEAGVTLMKPELYDKVWDIVEGVMKNPTAAELLTMNSAIAEQSIFARSRYHDILLKVRPDLWIPEADIIVDLKTTKCAAITGNNTFAKSCGQWRYDRQCAMYKLVVDDVTGNEHEFFFVAVETEPPYACVVFQMSEEDEKIGYKDFMSNVYDLAQFLKYPDNFPQSGYSDSVETINIPKYFRR
jgi:hypothetical protein